MAGAEQWRGHLEWHEGAQGTEAFPPDGGGWQLRGRASQPRRLEERRPRLARDCAES